MNEVQPIPDVVFLALAPLGKVPPDVVAKLQATQLERLAQGEPLTLFQLLEASGGLSDHARRWFQASAAHVIEATLRDQQARAANAEAPAGDDAGATEPAAAQGADTTEAADAAVMQGAFDLDEPDPAELAAEAMAAAAAEVAAEGATSGPPAAPAVSTSPGAAPASAASVASPEAPAASAGGAAGETPAPPAAPSGEAAGLPPPAPTPSEPASPPTSRETASPPPPAPPASETASPPPPAPTPSETAEAPPAPTPAPPAPEAATLPKPAAPASKRLRGARPTPGKRRGTQRLGRAGSRSGQGRRAGASFTALGGAAVVLAGALALAGWVTFAGGPPASGAQDVARAPAAETQAPPAPDRAQAALEACATQRRAALALATAGDLPGALASVDRAEVELVGVAGAEAAAARAELTALREALASRERAAAAQAPPAPAPRPPEGERAAPPDAGDPAAPEVEDDPGESDPFAGIAGADAHDGWRPSAPVPAADDGALADDDEDDAAPAGWSIDEEELDRPRSPAELRQLAALTRVADAYDRRDLAAVRAAAAEVERQGADGAIAWGARALLHFTAAQFTKALTALDRAEGVLGARGREARALATFFLGRHPAARTLAAEGGFPDADTVLRLIDGPFRGRYPCAADALQETTPKGRYVVMTDLGLDAAALDALERKLAAIEDPERRAQAAARARKGHKGLQELRHTMDQAYTAYDKLFGIDRPEELVPTVYVFSSQSDFGAFSRALKVGSTENTLGYYLPGLRVLVFFDMNDRTSRRRGLLDKGTLETLMHETFHQWIHLYVQDAPTWFNEGMAEYFGICDLNQKRLRYGLLPEGYPSRLHTIREAIAGELPPGPFDLAALLRATRRTWDSRPYINYAQAWSFCHYMAAAPERRKLLRSYFGELREGRDAEAAYREVFGEVDLRALEQGWRDYVARLK